MDNHDLVVAMQIEAAKAIQVLINLDPYTPYAQKNGAESFIKQLKDSPECMNVVGHIISSDNMFTTKTLALSILNDWIRLWWNRMAESQKSSLQDFVMECFASQLTDTKDNALRTKIAVVIANIAERQFPQQWSSFIERLVPYWIENPSSSIGRVLVSMRAMEYILSDCFDPDFNSDLPSQRRQDIIAGLREKLPIVTEALLISARNSLGNLRLSGGDLSLSADVEAKLLSSMLLFSQICSLVTAAEDICTAENRFEGLLCECLGLLAAMYSNPSAAAQVQRAVPLLLAVIDAIKAVLHLEISCPQLCGRFVEGIITSSSYIASLLPIIEQQGDLESLQFRRSYTATLLLLISQNVSLLFGNKLLEGVLEQLLTVSLELLRHPSRRISGDVQKDWIKIFKEAPMNSSISLNNIGVAVLQEYMKKSRRPLCLEFSLEKSSNLLSPSDCDLLRKEVEDFDFEFDDKDDWNDFFSTFKSQLANLVHAISQRSPFGTVQMLLRHLSDLIGRYSNPLTSPLESKCVILDLEVFNSIYNVALLSYNNAATVTVNINASTSSTASFANSEEAIAIAAEESLTSTLRQLILWTPADKIMAMERLRLLSYHATYLRRHETLLRDIYSAVFPIITADSQPGTADKEDGSLSTRAANLIVTLTQSCSELLATSSFLEGLLTTFASVLEQSKNSSVKNSMRECLISLSERISSESQHDLKVRVLNIALLDVIADLSSASSLLFSSTETFLRYALSASPKAVNPLPSGSEDMSGEGEESKGNAKSGRLIASYRFHLSSFVQSAKKANIPDELLSADSLSSFCHADIVKLFPLSAAWEMVLPSLFTGIAVLHSLWRPDIRTQISNLIGDASKSFLLSGLLELTSQANVKLAAITLQQPSHWHTGNELKELRLWLYQSLAQACLHRSIFLPALSVQHDSFVTQLVTDCDYLENSHLSQFCKLFVEPYLIHSPPSQYGIVSNFLAGFLSSVLRRLSFAWDVIGDVLYSPLTTNVNIANLNEQDYFTFLYRHCSFDSGYLQLYCANGSSLGAADLESLREGIVTDFTRAISELLMAINGLKGQLSIPVLKSTDETTTKADIESSLVVGVNKVEWLEAERQNKKQLLQILLTSPVFAHVTRQYVLTLFAMLSVPDSATIKRCIAILSVPGGLIARAASDKRLTSFVATDVFSKALHILVAQDKLSAGLEWEIVDLLLEIYLVLRMGYPPAAVQSKPSTPSGQADIPLPNSINSVSENLSEAPLQCLLSLEGVTREDIRRLETDLSTNLVRKKRRGALKDLLAEPMRRVREAREQALTVAHLQQQEGGTFIPQRVSPGVDNLPARSINIFRSIGNSKRFVRQSEADSGESFGLASIFDS